MKPKVLQLMLVVIFVLALTARLLVFANIGLRDPSKFYTFDSNEYVTLAKNLLEHGIFSLNNKPPFSPELIRTPIYPVLLVAIFFVVGYQLAVVIALQILVGSLTALLVFLLASRLELGAWTGLVAAGLVALDPVSILLSNYLLTETLFTGELVAGLWLFVQYWRREQLRWLIASAIVLALAALTRPVAQFLPCVLVLFIAVKAKHMPWRTVVQAGLLFALLNAALVSAWAYRNYRASGIFTLSTISDVNLLYYRARDVLATAENISQDAERAKLEHEIKEAAVQRNLTPAGTVSLERQRAIEAFKQHPGLTLAMLAKGAIRLLADPGYTIACAMLDPTTRSFECFSGDGSMLAPSVIDLAVGKFLQMNLIQRFTLAWSALLLILLYLGATAGVFFLIRQNKWFALLFLAAVIVYFIALSAGAETNYRFRAPIVPLISIAAGFGYQQLLSGRRARRAHFSPEAGEA